MTNKINGIDVSEYFIDVVDEGGSTIDYKILPNSERLLVEKIFEQNQQLKRLQEENEGLKSLNDFNIQKIEVLQEENERLNQELDIKEKMLDKFMIDSGETLEKLQKENEKLKADLKGETEQCQKWYQLETDKHFQMLKYEQALEEIREALENISKNIMSTEHSSEIDFMCKTINEYENLRVECLVKIIEVLEDSDVENK